MRLTLLVLAFCSSCGPRGERNIFSFCRDFSGTTCSAPLKGSAVYQLEKSRRSGTMRDFWNSVYFRGDRLAFELRHADARRAVTFECLRGYYHFEDNAVDRYELEYLELKENNVYGLVMLGSLLEKRLGHVRDKKFERPAPFSVTYSVYCSNDLLSRSAIQVRMD